MPKGISGCNAKHAAEKPLVVAQTFQLIAQRFEWRIKSQAVEAETNEESLLTGVLHPPQERSSVPSWLTLRCQTGVVCDRRSWCHHDPVARKARVKQVKLWTYPSVELVPLCTEMVTHDPGHGLCLWSCLMILS